MSENSSATGSHDGTHAARPPNLKDVRARDSKEVQLPIDQELVLKVIPLPGDCNANGDIFGGWVMAQVDLAGSIVPARYTQGRMATVAVNQFIFKQPVRVGDLLSFFCRVEKVGRTSITVKIEVYAERIRAQRKYIKVTEASLTYVAIDENGQPRPLPNPGGSHLMAY